MTLYRTFSGVTNLPNPYLESSRRQEESNARDVNAMMGAMPDGPHEQGVSGTSSAANFIKQVNRIIDAKVRSPDDHREENLERHIEDQFASRVARKRTRVIQGEPETGSRLCPSNQEDSRISDEPVLGACLSALPVR